ncbi:sulfite exporter TauE/SafE family protein [Kocuria rhizophila]|uniref:sulfite exporter TauE/SafE family protein n=1 Tax=Kocuria rhizophila TaxID=72000 RepID=UPI0025AFACB4|nr:sulfite exporter TauE/SafE family protein [Kocuria rhizophila]MDN3225578.1 sulfite exporter TauE/SafE family protein [Kocuria rhizophila]
MIALSAASVPAEVFGAGGTVGFEWWQVLLILVAGLWAGTINTIVGSGTLVTFPVLVTMGVPPVTASMSNAMGLIAGNLTGAWSYRSELRGLKRTLLKLLPCSVAGGVIGAVLLLHLPEEVFEVVAPVLIVVALLFVVFQPRLQAVVRARKERQASTPGAAQGAPGHDAAVPTEAGTAASSVQVDGSRQPAVLYVLVFLAGIYGGYFVAAQGVLLVGILGVFLLAPLQSANAVKNALVAAVNIVAAISYVLLAFDRINWWVVLLIAVSSTVGSWLGAKIGKRMSPVVLRTVIVVLGLVALANMVSNLL